MTPLGPQLVVVCIDREARRFGGGGGEGGFSLSLSLSVCFTPATRASDMVVISVFASDTLAWGSLSPPPPPRSTRYDVARASAPTISAVQQTTKHVKHAICRVCVCADRRGGGPALCVCFPANHETRQTRHLWRVCVYADHRGGGPALWFLFQLHNHKPVCVDHARRDRARARRARRALPPGALPTPRCPAAPPARRRRGGVATVTRSGCEGVRV
jgi:hypothetical protein